MRQIQTCCYCCLLSLFSVAHIDTEMRIPASLIILQYLNEWENCELYSGVTVSGYVVLIHNDTALTSSFAMKYILCDIATRGLNKWFSPIHYCIDFNNTRRIEDADIGYNDTGNDLEEEKKGFDIWGQPSS